jgi:L-fucose mutarotase
MQAWQDDRMLKGIDPMLNGALLGALQDMGHGDVLALVDRNYPAVSTSNRLVGLPGTDIGQVARAVFSVFPVDTFVEPAAFRMGEVGNEAAVLAVHAEFQAAVDQAEGRSVAVEPLERFEFYRRASQAFLTVATSEDRPYGCFLVVKGVV